MPKLPVVLDQFICGEFRVAQVSLQSIPPGLALDPGLIDFDSHLASELQEFIIPPDY